MWLQLLPERLKLFVRSSKAGPTSAAWLFRGVLSMTAVAALLVSARGSHEGLGYSVPTAKAEKLATLPANIGSSPRDAMLQNVAAGLKPTAGDLDLARPFHFHGSATDRQRAVDCLAMAAWYEAGDDPEGQRSVMQVVLNRLRHPNFPRSVCAVIFEGSQRTTGCQFTFTCDGSLARRTPSPAARDRARKLAGQALDGAIDPSVMQATHYHADYVAPVWRSELVRLNRVGSHIFYRWPGFRGALSGKGQYGPEISVSGLGNRGEGIAQAQVGQELTTEFEEAREQIVTNAIFLRVDRSAPSGRWALQALGECGRKGDCQVLAYEDSRQAERNRWVAARERDRPIFLFVRDANSGMAVSLWDCRKVERPQQSQCLPDDRSALDLLMRERA